MFPSQEIVEGLRKQYPSGTRVELIHMEDPYNRKLTPGCLGTVTLVDSAGTIHVNWDCGSSLGVAYGEDEVRIVKEVNKKAEQDLKATCQHDYMDAVYTYASKIADQRMTEVEQEMQRNPDAFPEYAQAKSDRDRCVEQLISKYQCDLRDVDQLESALNASGAVLAIETYLRGIMDGGRLHHAFVTGELPRKEDSNEQ